VARTLRAFGAHRRDSRHIFEDCPNNAARTLRAFGAHRRDSRHIFEGCPNNAARTLRAFDAHRRDSRHIVYDNLYAYCASTMRQIPVYCVPRCLHAKGPLSGS